MGIQRVNRTTVTTTQRFVVNGVEYRSLDEMPKEHRELFQDLDRNGIPDIIDRALREKGETGEDLKTVLSSTKTTYEIRGDGALARCRKCGYDLRGNIDGDRCPECGAPLAQALALTPLDDDYGDGGGGIRVNVQMPEWLTKLPSIALVGVVGAALLLVFIAIMIKMVLAMK